MTATAVAAAAATALENKQITRGNNSHAVCHR